MPGTEIDPSNSDNKVLILEENYKLETLLSDLDIFLIPEIKKIDTIDDCILKEEIDTYMITEIYVKDKAKVNSFTDLIKLLFSSSDSGDLKISPLPELSEKKSTLEEIQKYENITKLGKNQSEIKALQTRNIVIIGIQKNHPKEAQAFILCPSILGKFSNEFNMPKPTEILQNEQIISEKVNHLLNDKKENENRDKKIQSNKVIENPNLFFNSKKVNTKKHKSIVSTKSTYLIDIKNKIINRIIVSDPQNKEIIPEKSKTSPFPHQHI